MSFVRQILVILCCVATAATGLRAAEPDINFSRDIRPILSNACFHCHGPDEAMREADLRFDTEAGLKAALEISGEGVSELIRRINAEDASERMPPPESNKSLSADQKRLLEQWVAAGGVWEQHWSFVPPAMPDLPIVKQPGWCRNDIDRFILARLEGAGLKPSEPASPHQLVRRLYLDLIGLPPTTNEAAEWIHKIWPKNNNLSNAGPVDEAAYQELVNHLLSSPHYGERWARRWLDLARYADTNGYEKDRERSIWPYRDWVIEAFNRDMPFDQFTIEQVAGDMLPGAGDAQRVATGFHRNTMLNEEGGIDPLEFRFHAMTDRVATTGTTWLGLTLGCCQCHTHKYDPISHTEYYQLMAFLNNADEPELELPNPQLEQQWQQNREQAARLLDELATQWPLPEPEAGEAAEQPAHEESPAELASRRTAALQQEFSKWLDTERANAAQWQALRPVATASNLPILTIEEDRSIFASGDTTKRDDYDVVLAAVDYPITAIQLEALPDERLPAGGPGSTYYEGTPGDFFLTEIRFSAEQEQLPVKQATESYSKNRFGSNPATAALTIDGDVQTGWSVDGRQGQRHVAVFVLEKPLPPGQSLSVHMTFGRHFASSLGRFRLNATEAEHAPQARDFDAQTSDLLTKSESELSGPQRNHLLREFLLQAPQLASQTAEIRRLKNRPAFITSLVLSERPTNHPRPTRRHHRGEYLQPAEEVSAALPEILPGLPEEARPNRLNFAKWLVSEQNPLTARVVVNRDWQAFFGTGIVKTIDDFGLQGDSPSHPELLDYLALSLMADGWSMKSLHRKIVSSSVYRQSSAFPPSVPQPDPENRLLSRMPRFRLEAEVLRDSLLVVSGTLSDEVGGPPVRPLQPVGVTEVAYGSPTWSASSGADRYRRSIYTFVKRTAPFAMFSTFDAPSGEACIALRTRSNSPLQALTLLNDVMLVDLARATGKKFASQAATSTVQETLSQLFQAAVVRPGTRAELEQLSIFWQSQHDAFEADIAAAQELLGTDSSGKEPEPGISLATLAAWTATARAVFGLDEFQTRE